jgi:hypothetical protein
MATADDYANWIIANEAKKGTDEFNTVAQAYQEAKLQKVSAPNGNNYVPSAANIEKPVTVNEKSFLDTVAQKISAGKSGTMQDLIYGNEAPASTFMGKIGQVVQQSGIEGTTGIGPIGQIAPMSTKAGMATTNAISAIPTVAAETFPNAAKMASKIATVVKDAPANILSLYSNKAPEAFKTAYNIAREGKGALKTELKNEFEIGIDLQKKFGSQMNYNYARALGLPHEIAAKAVHYGQEMENGAWNLWNKYVAAHPDIPPAYINFATASPEQKIKMARQAGVDLGQWSPLPPNTGQIQDVIKAAKLIIPTVIPHGWWSAPLTSPRIAGVVATGAGKAVNAASYVPSLLQASKNSLSGPQLTSLLGLLGKNNE